MIVKSYKRNCLSSISLVMPIVYSVLRTTLMFSALSIGSIVGCGRTEESIVLESQQKVADEKRRQENESNRAKWDREQQVNRRQVGFSKEREVFEAKFYLLRKLANAEIENGRVGHDAETRQKLENGYEMFGEENGELNDLIERYWDAWEKWQLAAMQKLLDEPMPVASSTSDETKLYLSRAELTGLQFLVFRISSEKVGRKKPEFDAIWDRYRRHVDKAIVEVKINGMK